ncbi:MAG: hypothetical protein AAGD35_08710 [Actinomycetota bacterium]
MAHNEPVIDVEELLNPEEQHRFRNLCLPTSADELAQLPEVVELHLHQIREDREANTDVATAEAIGASLLALLSENEAFDADDRALIRGAVEYFLLADDASDDIGDVLGFDDDARVLNAVLTRIDRTRYLVDLG